MSKKNRDTWFILWTLHLIELDIFQLIYSSFEIQYVVNKIIKTNLSRDDVHRNQPIFYCIY